MRSNSFIDSKLVTKPWIWMLGGIMIVAIFLYFAQSIIVFVGGTALGLYLFRTYAPSDNKQHDNYDILTSFISDLPPITSIVTKVKEWVKQEPPKVEHFSYQKYFPHLDRWRKMVERD